MSSTGKKLTMLYAYSKSLFLSLYVLEGAMLLFTSIVSVPSTDSTI